MFLFTQIFCQLVSHLNETEFYFYLYAFVNAKSQAAKDQGVQSSGSVRPESLMSQ